MSLSMEDDRNLNLSNEQNTIFHVYPSSFPSIQSGIHSSIPIVQERTMKQIGQQKSNYFKKIIFVIGVLALLVIGALLTAVFIVVYQRSKPIVNLKINPSVINLTQNDSMQLQSPLPYLTEEDFERSKTLTNEQIGINLTDLREELPKQSSSARANVWRDSRYKWPNARVPYVISSRYNSNERAVIAQVIQEWHSKTCIRFAPKTNADRDYIELTPDDGTSNYCYSYIGRQGGRQYVKMYSPTCMSVGQYIHELGHAVGFGHEHQRPDRDYYVKMNWANIDPKFQYNYDKYSADYFTTMNMPYDYYSIMHYPDYSYSSNGKPAFVPTYPGYNVHAMNVKLTSTDIQKVKKYYNC